MAQPGSVPISQGDTRHWRLGGNVVWFRGQLRGTGQIKFSLKFQAGHGSPGEGPVPDSTERPGEAVQGVGGGPSHGGIWGVLLLFRLLLGMPCCVLGDRRGNEETKSHGGHHFQSTQYVLRTFGSHEENSTKQAR